MFVLKQKNDNWWIAPWKGDPGRTLKLENAREYKSIRGAAVALLYYKNRYSHIHNIDLEIIRLEK